VTPTKPAPYVLGLPNGAEPLSACPADPGFTGEWNAHSTVATDSQHFYIAPGPGLVPRGPAAK